MREPDCLVVIPARMTAKRFPSKPLADAGGRPLLWHAWHTAFTWPRAASVVVASPDEEILSTVQAFGGTPHLSDPALRNGSLRAFEVLARNPRYSILLNLQADEPLVTHAMLDQLAEAVYPDGPLPRNQVYGATIATLAAPFPGGVPVPDPNIVKVVVNRLGRAMYFSRSPLLDSLQHVGVYAFRSHAVPMLAKTVESSVGRTECLEQLDWLADWWDVRVVVLDAAPPAVNTPRDLERIRPELERRVRECEQETKTKDAPADTHDR